MVAEMIHCFLADADSLLPQMRAAIEKGDLQEVGRLGHRLKGTVVYLGAEPAREAALRVERFCKSSGGTRSEAEAAVAALEHECLVLQAALREQALAAEPKSSAKEPLKKRALDFDGGRTCVHWGRNQFRPTECSPNVRQATLICLAQTAFHFDSPLEVI